MAKDKDRRAALAAMTQRKTPTPAAPVQPVKRGRGRPPGTDNPLGKRRAYSIGLREAEFIELEQIAAANGLYSDAAQTKPNLNAVAVFLLRWAVQQYRAGRVKIPTKARTVIAE